MLTVAGGSVQLGRPSAVSHFGWDNEFGQLKCDVEPFEVTANLISNSEFLEFVQAGGYRRDDLWTTEGLAWRRAHRVERPRFWIERAPGQFDLRTVFDERKERKGTLGEPRLTGDSIPGAGSLVERAGQFVAGLAAVGDGGARNGDRTRPRARGLPHRCRDRRRGDVGRHGLIDEQRG